MRRQGWGVSSYSTSAMVLLALAWVGLALASSPSLMTRCTTSEVKSLSRLRTLCDDGTRAVHTYNKTLSRWESTVTPPPGKACTGRLNPKTRQWEGRC